MVNLAPFLIIAYREAKKRGYDERWVMKKAWELYRKHHKKLTYKRRKKKSKRGRRR